MRVTTHTSHRLLTAAILLAIGLGQAHAQGYTVKQLGSLGGDSTYARDINNAGQIVGYSATGTTANGGNAAVIWQGNQITTIGNGAVYPSAISASGLVVGDIYDRSYQDPSGGGTVGRYVAAKWNGASSSALAAFSPGEISHANGINDAGLVVGTSTTGYEVSHALVWRDAGVTDLGLGQANGVNNTGLVVGTRLEANSVHAFVWNGSAMTLLDGGDASMMTSASALNEAGQVVGQTAYVGGEYGHATIWNGNVPTLLDVAAGAMWGSNALDVNAAGSVVGYAYSNCCVNSYQVAMLWTGGQAYDLNSFLDGQMRDAGWVLTDAVGINDAGSIVVNGLNERLNVQRAFVVTPVPEPGTWAMMLLGFGALGAVARRRPQTV